MGDRVLKGKVNISIDDDNLCAGTARLTIIYERKAFGFNGLIQEKREYHNCQSKIPVIPLDIKAYCIMIYQKSTRMSVLFTSDSNNLARNKKILSNTHCQLIVSKSVQIHRSKR